MKTKNLLSVCLITAILCIAALPANSATIVSAASGNWNVGTTWIGGVPPNGTDDVIIDNGHTVTVTAVASCNKITVVGNGTLVCNAALSLPNGVNIIDGTVDITVANGLKKQTAGNNPTVLVNSSGKIKFGTLGTTNISNWTLNAGSTVEYYGSAQSFCGHMSIYSNVILSGSGLKTLALATTIKEKLSMQGTATFDLGGFTLTYGPASTIEYKGSAFQTIGPEFPATFGGTGGIIINNQYSVNLIGIRTITYGLTVTTGPFVISPTSQLTVNGTTSLSGPNSMILQSNASSTASFIDNGTITYSGGANVDCQRYLSSDLWHYMCIPFPTINAWTYLTLYMKYYSEPTHHFKYVIAPGADSTLKSNGLGYAMWFTSPVTVNQVNDSLNTGPISIPVTRTWDAGTSDFDGWNMVGNPYPSSINLSLLSRTNIEASAWFWNPEAANYVVWPSGGGGSHSNICPPEQAFFVHCNDPAATQSTPGTGTLGLTNAARIHSTEIFLKNSDDPLNLLRVKAAGSINTFYDETSIYFSDSQTNGYDPGFDAEKISGEPIAPQLYTTIPDYRLSVNALPFSQSNMVIPMGFSDNIADTYTLTASGFESFQPDITIQLEDLKEGFIQDLRTDPLYIFDHAASDDPNRFLLHFGDPNLGNNEIDKTGNLIEVYSFNDRVYVRYTGSGPLSGNITVYDVIGRELFTGTIRNSRLQEFSLTGYQGCYVARVISSEGTVCKKIFL